MWSQNLPASATDYARATRLEKQAALAAIRRQARGLTTDFDESWARIAPGVLAVLGLAQQRTAQLADDYIPAVLEETGQARAVAAKAQTNVSAFVGVAGSGVATSDLLAATPVQAKKAVAAGASPEVALGAAQSWLTRTAGTVLADTARAVEATGMATRPVTGYVRMLVPPSCGRCAILAGKRYAINKGFERHPGCDCKHIPASESVAGDLSVDFEAYLSSLDKPGQVKLLGSQSNWQAWSEYGANPTQIVNSYKWGVSTAQSPQGLVKFTMQGTSKRGLAGVNMRRASRLDRDAGSVLVDGRRQMVRRMPETILKTTQSKDQVLRQLRLYGWVL